MPEVKFDRDYQKLDCLGLDLNRPVDSVKAMKFPYMKNCRSFLAGRIEPRDGLTKIAQVVAGQSNVHSVRRLNDPLNNTYQRIVGAGTHLAYGQTTFTDVDSGYSGNPLALVPYKPADSPVAFMYVADTTLNVIPQTGRMRKINSSGSLHTIGWAPPNVAPGVTLSNAPVFKVVQDFTSLSNWAGSGQAGGPSLLHNGPGYRTNTNITTIVYDNAPTNTGWASVIPANMAGIGPGALLNFLADHGGLGVDSDVTVQVSFPNSSSTTIGAIVYDSGSSGACSLTFAGPLQQVFCDAILNNSTRSENVRILAVNPGPDGTNSVRVSTSATWAAGDTVQIQASFRVYLPHTHSGGSPGDSIQMDGIRTVLASGNGAITNNSTTLDLTQLSSTLLASPSDYMHISFRVDTPANLTEVRVSLAVDASPAQDANGGFTGNYFFKAFRAADITAALAGTQSVLVNRTTVVQRSIVGQPNATPQQIAAAAPPPVIDPNTGEDVYQFADYTYTDPTTGITFQQTVQAQYVDSTTGQPVNDNTSLQIGTGVSQWSELIFPISDLMRVGTDTSKSLANVTEIQLFFIATGAVNFDVNSWWIGGGYGLDNVNATATPYHYRYRVREKATNVPSMWGPASRYNLQANRQSVDVKPTQYTPVSGTSLGTGDFWIDIERFGGQLADWHYVGTVPNSASSPNNPVGPTFTDIYDDNLVGGQPIIGQTDYQPWPIIGAPVNGTTGQVAGTSVKDSGTNFNLNWSPGTRILINNIPYTIRRVISTSLLETLENAGTQSAVTYRLDAPTILNQPLPCLWDFNGTLFACGDNINPGRLYYSNANSETTQPTNTLDVTSSSEPLMNGYSDNIRPYVFSSENFFQIISSSSIAAISENIQLQASPTSYEAQKIINGKGLFSRWALTREPAPIRAFLSKDGINMTTGGAPIPLTDADMYELFPNEGNLGVAVNGITPPNVVNAQAANLRLAYYDEYLYFDYQDTQGNQGTLVLAFDLGAAVRGEAPGGWFWDIYNSNNPGAVMHYGEEGQGVHSLLIGTTGVNLYQYTGNSDDGTAISMEISTPSRDQGDTRSNKLYGDVMIDCNLGGLTATAKPFFNNNNPPAGPATSITNTQRGLVSIPMAAVASGTSWVTARNISINIVVLVSTSVRPFFFAWEPRWTFESAPISSVSWEISPSTFGMNNYKHVGLAKITHVSTVDLNLIFTIDGVVQPVINVPNSGGVYTQSVVRVPVMKAKLYKIRLASSDGTTEFRLDGRDTWFEVMDWASRGEYERIRAFSDFSLVEG